MSGLTLHRKIRKGEIYYFKFPCLFRHDRHLLAVTKTSILEGF